MEVRGNEIYIHRGESFTLDSLVEWPDGTPFMITKDFDNCYILVSVSDSPYEKEGRYVLNHWLDYTKSYSSETVHDSAKYLKFTVSKPVDIQTITDSGGEVEYSSLGALGNAFASGNNKLSGIYIDGKYVSEVTNDYSVFYNSKDNPKRYVFIDSTYGQCYDYRFEIIDSFNTEETKDWYSKKYYYSIQVVDGTSMLNYLKGMVRLKLNKELEELEFLSVDELYLMVKDFLPSTFDVTSPLAKITHSVPILPPTPIYVTEYMQGGVL